MSASNISKIRIPQIKLIMKTLPLLHVFAIGLLFQAAALCSDGGKPTISVAPTESQLPVWQPALGEGLAQMMLTELAKLPNVQVLESLALDDLREERSLGESGEVAKFEKIRKGSWKGSDYTFKTTITRFGADESQSGGGLSIPVGKIRGLDRVPLSFGDANIHFGSQRHEVQIDWRIVDNTTRAVVKSGRGTGTETGKRVSFSGFGGAGFKENREFFGSALGKATMKAIAGIVTELEEWNPPARSGRDEIAEKKAAESYAAEMSKRDSLRRARGEVLVVDGDDVWIGLGSNRGFAKGDRMMVYRKIEKRNKAGVIIVTDFEQVCEIELDKVLVDKSRGRKPQNAKIDEGAPVALSSLEITQVE
jgi:curli biogenesis system outer membrane secretion channel CsgG